MKKINNQSGFGVIEVLLTIIVVILLVFVGWYIYHTDHKNTASTSSSTKSSSNSTAKTVNYFTITQWGVRAPYSGKLTLSYTISTIGGLTGANLTSAQLNSSGSACLSGSNYGGVIIRYASTDMVQNADGSNSGLTPSEYFTQNNISSSTYAHIGNYYYWYIHPQGVCGSSQSSQNVETETDSAFASIVQNLQPTPSIN